MAEPFRAERPVPRCSGSRRAASCSAPRSRGSSTLGFVPARKPGKLPRESVRVTYGLEYGRDSLEIHADAFSPGERVLVADDVLATGGTARAAAELVERLGAEVVGPDLSDRARDARRAGASSRAGGCIRS